MSEAQDWAGRVAVVTGGGSGIGAALCRRFAEAGMSIVVADVDKPAAVEVAGQLADEGVLVADARALPVRVDVASADEVAALGEATMDAFGAVHLVCNNAGVSAGGLSWEVPMSDWQWVMEVNLWGVVYGVRTFVPLIVRSGGGHIVNTASMAGLTSPPFMSPYSVAKHGVVALSEALYHELSFSHPEVGASVLCPGWVRTRIHEAGRNRPQRHGGPTMFGEGGLSEGEEGADGPGAMVAQLIASGMDPSEVADLVWSAVLERRFWVFTGDDWIAMAAERARGAFA
ncbi:MAG: SDR family NAD(P)-dependent oxidoreductase, partial [Candidatus Microthrix parvicella]